MKTKWIEMTAVAAAVFAMASTTANAALVHQYQMGTGGLVDSVGSSDLSLVDRTGTAPGQSERGYTTFYEDTASYDYYEQTTVLDGLFTQDYTISIWSRADTFKKGAADSILSSGL
ncbi:hypothetical protein P4B35_24085, partial [Pontiellaceae bacterium B12227]|nr:hypothetical protein [Pontiellaceae bacterium B12227]